MNRTNEMASISGKERLVQTVGYHPTLTSKGYLVLTKSTLGWHPHGWASNLPFLFPEKYYIAPLSEVRCVTFRQPDLFGWTKVQLQCGDEENAGMIDIVVQSPHLWYTALRDLGIPIVGGVDVRLTTIRGFFNNYGWFVPLIAVNGSLLVLAMSLAVRNPQLVLIIWALFFSVASAVNLLMRAWSKHMLASVNDEDGRGEVLRFCLGPRGGSPDSPRAS